MPQRVMKLSRESAAWATGDASTAITVVVTATTRDVNAAMRTERRRTRMGDSGRDDGSLWKRSHERTAAWSTRKGGRRIRRLTGVNMVVAPSLRAADYARSADQTRAVEGEANWPHVDVMDYHFVPNLTAGLPVVQSLRAATPMPLACHLMISNPWRWAMGYA